MEPQDNGYSKPDLPLSPQKNQAEWWQSPQERINGDSIGSGQIASPIPRSMDNSTRPQLASVLATPQIASDKDLIEDEWVEVVKKDIETSRGDPYTQSKAITLLRVDYMKKRYNKDIKVPES